MKHAGQESGGELCEIFIAESFLQSKSVNNVYKLLQLLEELSSAKPLYRGLPLDPTGDFRPQTPWGIPTNYNYRRRQCPLSSYCQHEAQTYDTNSWKIELCKAASTYQYGHIYVI